eukprot:3488393-Pyramimonas_sp.AAC.1
MFISTAISNIVFRTLDEPRGSDSGKRVWKLSDCHRSSKIVVSSISVAQFRITDKPTFRDATTTTGRPLSENPGTGGRTLIRELAMCECGFPQPQSNASRNCNVPKMDCSLT